MPQVCSDDAKARRRRRALRVCGRCDDAGKARSGGLRFRSAGRGESISSSGAKTELWWGPPGSLRVLCPSSRRGRKRASTPSLYHARPAKTRAAESGTRWARRGRGVGPRRFMKSRVYSRIGFLARLQQWKEVEANGQRIEKETETPWKASPEAASSDPQELSLQVRRAVIPLSGRVQWPPNPNVGPMAG